MSNPSDGESLTPSQLEAFPHDDLKAECCKVVDVVANFDQRLQEGRLPFFCTLGGHRRYPDREIRALLATLSELSPAG